MSEKAHKAIMKTPWTSRDTSIQLKSLNFLLLFLFLESQVIHCSHQNKNPFHIQHAPQGQKGRASHLHMLTQIYTNIQCVQRVSFYFASCLPASIFSHFPFFYILPFKCRCSLRTLIYESIKLIWNNVFDKFAQNQKLLLPIRTIKVWTPDIHWLSTYRIPQMTLIYFY